MDPAVGIVRQLSGSSSVLQIVLRTCLPVLALSLACWMSAPAAASPCAAQSVTAATDQYCEMRHEPGGQGPVRSARGDRLARLRDDMPAGAMRDLRRAAARHPALRAVLAVASGPGKAARNDSRGRREHAARRTEAGTVLRPRATRAAGPSVTAAFGIAMLLSTIGWIAASRVRTRTHRD